MLKFIVFLSLLNPLLAVQPLGAPDYAARDSWHRYSVRTPAGPSQVSPETLKRLPVLAHSDYKLKSGDHVGALARAFGTNIQSLQNANGEDLILLQPGQKIKVLNRKGLLYEVKSGQGERLESIVQKYQKDPKKARELKEKVVWANDLPPSALLRDFVVDPGMKLLIPHTYVDYDTYRFPFRGQSLPRVSSGFGRRFHPVLRFTRSHDGLDFPKPYGTSVYPSRSGRVQFAGWQEGYGRLVIIRHGDGATTRYGHLSQVHAKKGQWVSRAKTLIGKVGQSGLSTGPHLHFEVRDRFGKPVNPSRKIGRK